MAGVAARGGVPYGYVTVGAADGEPNHSLGELRERLDAWWKLGRRSSATSSSTPVTGPGQILTAGGIGTAIVTFEDPFAGYFSSEEPPEWLQTQSRTEVWHIISGAPEDRLGDVLDRARQQGAGKIFVTDDEEPNPFDSLPTYWSAN